MKIKRAIVWLLMVCLPLLCPTRQVHAEDASHPDGIVAHCFDGDTMKLQDRRVVRLAGIDAPEMPRNGKPAQFYARQAKKALEGLARGQKVGLVFPGLNQHDRYGRLIADVRLENGESLNEKLIEQGAAFFYPHQDLTPDFQEKLASLQADAIQERRGLWDYLLAQPLANLNYVGNRASLRFFPADCPAVQTIKPRNRVNFGTLMDAFLAGYAPARVCQFWPDALKP